MNFDLSDDDAALQDSVARWVQQRYPFDVRRKLAEQAPGFSRAHWRRCHRSGERERAADCPHRQNATRSHARIPASDFTKPCIFCFSVSSLR